MIVKNYVFTEVLLDGLCVELRQAVDTAFTDLGLELRNVGYTAVADGVVYHVASNKDLSVDLVLDLVTTIVVDYLTTERYLTAEECVQEMQAAGSIAQVFAWASSVVKYGHKVKEAVCR